MKKLLVLFSLLLTSLAISAKSNPMSIEKGSIAELSNPDNTVWFVVNYDNAVVHNDEKKYTLNEYLTQRGDDLVADWNKNQRMHIAISLFGLTKRIKKAQKHLRKKVFIH